ncbi:unnamed protein product [Haemonchus placei]|uniref:CSN8_PSD8_EIF3K domain-containing protein n=1 Tax=Haemonchus placei TaxID=6290 RepID=A0A0N4X2A8_HAEPC|nr:unnamed protein product [Haemonchus placei]
MGEKYFQLLFERQAQLAQRKYAVMLLTCALRNITEKEPFPHWQLCDFLHVEPAVLKRLNDELIEYKGWNRKENDLYSLFQTPDLKTIDGVEYPTIRAFQ